MTNAPGLAPQEVERFITVPVERAVSGLPLVEELRSVTKFGLSVVTVVFEEGTDIYWARQLVSERLSEARDEPSPKATATPSHRVRSRPDSVRSTNSRCEQRTRVPAVLADTDACYSPMELRSILELVHQLPAALGAWHRSRLTGLWRHELKTYQVTLDPAKFSRRLRALSQRAVLRRGSSRSNRERRRRLHRARRVSST